MHRAKVRERTRTPRLARKHRDNTVPQPHAFNRSLTMSNCCSHDTLLHIGLRSCITSVLTVFQNSLLRHQLIHTGH